MAVKSNYKEDDSVVMIESCNVEWEDVSSGEEHHNRDPIEVDSNHLEKVANTVFNLFKNVCYRKSRTF